MKPPFCLAAAAMLLAVCGRADTGAAPKAVRLAPAVVRAGVTAVLKLDLRLPQGWRLDPVTPLSWRFKEVWAGFSYPKRKELLRSPKLPLRIQFQAEPGSTGARLALDYRYCRGEGDMDCRSGAADYLVVLEASPAEKTVEVPVIVEAPRP